MDKKKKVSLAVVLGIIIFIGVLFIAFNYDTLFSNKIEITYPDGCIELYEQNELVSPICEEGRVLEENLPDVFNIGVKTKNFTMNQ